MNQTETQFSPTEVGQFVDDLGNRWTIELDAPLIQKVREVNDVDLMDISDDGRALLRIEQDLILTTKILWTLLNRQAAVQGVEEAEFFRGMKGDGLGRAWGATLDAIANFFPPSRRSLLLATIEKNRTLTEQATALALSKINDPQLEAEILESISTKMDSEVANALTRFQRATPTREPSESGPTG